MAGIIPIPNTRVSSLLVRERLLAQLQADQLDLFRLQNQVSTGRRITLPSEDAPAARRAMTLQRLLERKEQLSSNVETGQSFLQATDVALNNVAELLGDVRGLALGAAGTTSTEAIRNEAIAEIDGALSQLLLTANTQFRGRYLFAGSQTNIEPYALEGGFVRYSGDAKALTSFSDLRTLFSTNAAGEDVFGGMSNIAIGSEDLNPQVTQDTLLSTLRNGRGISPNGALQISDGTNSRIIDISRAVTVGDVIDLIEAQPPAGRQVTATLNGRGITLQLDASGGGSLKVTEVASGKAASELGILETAGVSTGPLIGADLDPIITKTTPLNDLLGVRARARLESPGNNNDLLIQATSNGPQLNGVTVQLVDDELLRADAGVAQGSEYAEFAAAQRAPRASLRLSGSGNDLTITATAPGTAYNNVRVVVAGASGLGNNASAAYDPVARQLTITIDDAGATTIDAVVNEINATGLFTASHDPSLEGAGAYNPLATVSASDVGNAFGNTGNSGGNANTLYVYVKAGASTANDVARAISAEGTFSAHLDAFDTTHPAQAGLGIASINASTTTSGGSGVNLDLASGLRITNAGTTHTITFASAVTVEDLLNTLNGSDAGLHAEINAEGSGINVRSRLSGADFQIAENGGLTATQLGLRSFTGDTVLADLNHGVGVPTAKGNLLELPDPPPAVTPDFTITASDGTASVDLVLDVSAATTVQDVIDLINEHPLNNAAGVAVTARLATTGNGIELVDDNGRPLTITAAEGSEAAEYLGLLPAGATTTTGAAGVITGSDRYFHEAPGVFTTLVRLKEALAANDIAAMNRAIEDIDADLDRVVFARSDVGAREQALEVTAQNLEDEDVQLRTSLADEIEVDLVEAISNLTARQVSLEASLRATANIMQLSLLNYL